MKRSLYIIVLIFIGRVAAAQAPGPEVMYLGVNDVFFVAGETLNVAVQLSGGNASAKSSVAYLALVDEQSTVALQVSVDLMNGCGSGTLYLPSSLPTGGYTLVGYTRWMRNFGYATFARRQLFFVNPFRLPSLSAGAARQVEIVPESGVLIANTKNKVWCRLPATFSQRAKKLHGAVLDEAGKSMTEFDFAADGLASFQFIPLANQKYRIALLDSAGNAQFTPLPQARQGLTLAVKDSSDWFQVTMTGPASTASSKAILSVVNGKTQHEFKDLELSERPTRLVIPKKGIGVGKSLWTLSLDTMSVRREVWSAPPTTELSLNLASDQYSFREGVDVKIHAFDTTLITAMVSVRRKGNISSLPERGFTAAPTDYELLMPSPRTDHDMDMESYGRRIDGRVLGADRMPVSKVQVWASAPDEKYFFAVTTTDSSGRFRFNLTPVKKNIKVMVQPDPERCAACQVILTPTALQDYSSFKPQKLEITPAVQEEVKQRSLWSQIENAYFEVKRDSLTEPVMPERFYGKADFTYVLDDYVRFTTMKDICIEFLAEVVYRQRDNHAELRVKDIRTRKTFEGKPLILVDGIPVADDDKVMQLNPLDIQRIEVVAQHYFYGPMEMYGIISITTYVGNGAGLAPSTFTPFESVQPAKVGFQPNYARSKLDRIPDDRIQLAWLPAVRLKSDYSFRFFTSDVAGDYEIFVDGLSKDGRHYQARKIIHVGGR